MGYQTQFTLEVESDSDVLLLTPTGKLQVIAELRETSPGANYALNEDGSTFQPAKWYEYKAELLALSKKYPHLRFTLRGTGEESEDIWALYVVNGKAQEAKAVITVEPFNRVKLK